MMYESFTYSLSNYHVNNHYVANVVNGRAVFD